MILRDKRLKEIGKKEKMLAEQSANKENTEARITDLKHEIKSSETKTAKAAHEYHVLADELTKLNKMGDGYKCEESQLKVNKIAFQKF